MAVISWTQRNGMGVIELWESKGDYDFEIKATEDAALWEGGNWLGDYPTVAVAKEVAEYLVKKRS